MGQTAAAWHRRAMRDLEAVCRQRWGQAAESASSGGMDRLIQRREERGESPVYPLPSEGLGNRTTTVSQGLLRKLQQSSSVTRCVRQVGRT